jgi:predicted kinase
MADPQLIAFAGLARIGKNSLARAVARQVHAVYLDKDTVKACVLEVSAETRSAGVADLAGSLAYRLLLDQARDNLTLGMTVVLDSPAAQESFRSRVRQLVRGLKVDLRWIECVSSDETFFLPGRPDERNAAAVELPTGGDRTYGAEGRERYERMTDRRLVVDTAEPQALNVHKILQYLEQQGPREGAGGAAD